VAEAQPPGKVYRIGFLSTNPPPARAWDALLDGLQERGYREGRNLVFERRFSEGHAERFPAFAAEMVRLRVDSSCDDARRARRQARDPDDSDRHSDGD
jgi:putative ABC transport system substrate-binding protein